MPNLPNGRSVVRFGAFEADLSSGEVHKHGHKIKLQEQPFQVLVMLLERPGKVITREELRTRLWTADTFVDFDTGLNSAIKKLRDALGDSAEEPVYVETLPRRGYRFVAQLERQTVADVPCTQKESEASNKHAAEPVLGAVQSAPGLTRPRPWWRKHWVAFVASAVTLSALLGLAVGAWRGGLVRSAHAMGIESVAVLPLENMTGDPTQEYLVDGMTDALTTHLAQIRDIRVISRTSAMRFKGVKRTLPEIAQELHVDAVVEGSVSRSDGVMHVNAQLIYAPGDRHIWARSYEGVQANLPTIESEIASDVARKIGVAMTPDSSRRLSMTLSVNQEAYDLYLRAERYYGIETREANDEAIRLLEKSVAADAKFAAGYAALAAAYRVRAFSVEPEQTQKWMEKATAAVQRSLSLDANLAEAYVSRGYLLWSRANDWSYERAVADYRHALELNPNLAEAHHQLANVYNHVGLVDKADAEIKKAVAVDPLNTGIRYRVAINLLYQGKYDESLAVMRDSQKFMPSLWAFQTSFALQHIGRRREAQERIDQLLKTEPPDRSGSLTAMQALLAADAGDAPLAQLKIQDAVAKGRGYQHFHHVAYAVASAYALLDKHEQALRYLRMAADDGFPCYPLFEHDSNLNKLRTDPRFLSFMAEQKKQWEYFRVHL
jgi:TolB-like protein/DNA-binding winged helix-turn-helix (wHTH) protein/Flp pilus assembly protein TadD